MQFQGDRMTRKMIFSLIAFIGMAVSGMAASDPKPSVGIVNFTTCMTESKLGQQEQSSFESLKTQMSTLLEDTEKQINELATKFNDADYMDGLSPDAEEVMKNKFTTLNEEMNRYQNQYYQVLNQANMKIVQSLGASIQTASSSVASSKKLSMVMNKEACFYAAPTLDVTNLVIAEMDKTFEKMQVSTEAPAAPAKTTSTKAKKG